MSQMTEELLGVIDAPHFYAGVVLRHGRVIETAPIVRFMMHWSVDRVCDYCLTKGWRADVVSGPPFRG
jgi:hypothetical protein